MEVEDIDNLSRNQDIAVGLQVILKPRARPTPTWTSMPERALLQIVGGDKLIIPFC